MKEEDEEVIIRIASPADCRYARQIAEETERSALLRGSGISKRSPVSIREKIKAGKAVIAVAPTGDWAGFSYIESWDHGRLVSNSGLIVAPAYRKLGIATAIKKEIFRLSRERYPGAAIFSITTGLTIMLLNSRLGFKPVTFSEITHEKRFWNGCKSCVNYPILKGNCFGNCLCTAMLFDPAWDKQPTTLLQKRNTRG